MMINSFKQFIKTNKRKFQFIAVLSVTIILVLLIILKVDWGEVKLNIIKITWWQVALYFIVSIFSIAIAAYKWRFLAKYKSIDLPYKDFFKYYLTGSFINNVTPSIIGSDTYRVYAMGKKEKKYIESVSVVLMDRITGLAALMIWAVFFSVLNYKEVADRPVLLMVNASLILLFFVFFAVLKSQKFIFWQKLKKYLPNIVMKILREIKHFRSGGGVLPKSIFLGMAFNLVWVGLANYVIVRALGINLGLLNYCSVIFLINILSLVPISINNIGVKEWAYIALFGCFGVPVTTAVTVAIISRFLMMLVSFLALPVYFREKGSWAASPVEKNEAPRS
ncbi:MAG: lysylphosphatidylglycerol synthase transmembrane domain-containing protein [Candidatus Moranbacteria bacterium]|nr:lysylphosphatidylglycerol synthase transmembrane domain-containing protein [Candidatus Moranbacteria bacterium]